MVKRDKFDIPIHANVRDMLNIEQRTVTSLTDVMAHKSEGNIG